MCRAHWLLSTLHLFLLTGFPPFLHADRSSSQRSPPLEDAAELFRDAPLYPPLRDDIPIHDNSELTQQTDFAYDAESSIEENNILVTPEESALDRQTYLSEDIDHISGLEHSIEEGEDSGATDIEDATDFHKYAYPQDKFFKSSLLNEQNSANYIFEASRDSDENSENLSFFTSTKDDTPKEIRIIRQTKEYSEEEFLDESNIPNKINKNVPLQNYIDLTEGNFVKKADVDSENIVLTSEKNIQSEGEVLLFPDSNIKDSILVTSEDVTVEDEEVNFVSQQEFDTTTETAAPHSAQFNNREAEITQERIKRSQHWDRSTKTASRRVKTGDTILNIRGDVRDAIGDAGAAPGPRPSTRLDAFVIRPGPVPRAPLHDEPRPDPEEPAPKPVTSEKERELVVAAHSSVRIPCDLHNVTDLRWYKDNEVAVLPAEGAAGAGGVLHIARAARPHAARWRCAGADSSGTPRAGRPTLLLVYEAVRSVYLAVDGRRLDAGNTWVPVRDKTVLEVRCMAEGGVPPPELSWRIHAQEPALDHRPYLRVYQTNSSIDGVRWSRAVVTAARELHNATLRCLAVQRRPAPSDTVDTGDTAPPAEHDDLAAKLQIHVTYPPSFVISRWPGFGARLRAGGAAALRCDVDANPPARAHWLRDDDSTSSSPAPLEGAGPEARGAATLRWGVLSEAHAGWYRCRASWLDAEYSSIGYYLNVLSAEEPQSPAEVDAAPEEPDHQKVDVPLGGNVQLHCPKGSVGCWWRRVVGNSSDTWAPAGSHHAHGVLGIRGALYQEAGEYRCVGARGADLQRLRELKRVTLRVTGGATATAVGAAAAPGGWRLQCVVCGRGVRALWLRGARASPAPLAPHSAPLCYRTVLLLPEPDEVWCVAVTSGGGAVAVFPRRGSPAPARHAQPGRAPPAAAPPLLPHAVALPLLLLLPLLRAPPPLCT